MSIDSFNSFFLSINKKSPNNEDINMILKKYNDYVHKITFTNNQTYLLDILSKKNELNIIKTILNNIKEVDKYYYQLYKNTSEDDIIRNNFIDIIHLYDKCLLHALIALYQYFIFIEEIIPLIDGCDEIIDIECLSSFFQIFKENENNSIIIDRNEILKQKIINSSRSNIDPINTLLIIYKITLIRFNELFFSEINDFPIIFNKINSKKINYLNEQIKKFKEKNINLYYQIGKLLINNIIINKNHNPSINKDKYITIPQYSGYCWFISFLTGLTYSDKNKDLLLRKRSKNDEKHLIKDIKEVNDATPINIIFNSLAYYIINNITREHKKYSEILSDNCEIFEYLRVIPQLFLNKLIEDHKQQFKECIIKMIERKQEQERPLKKSKITYDDQIIEQIMEQQIDKNLSENTTNPNNYIYRSLKIKSLGLYNNDTIIIKKFYKFLNIDCLFIYEINDEMYTIKKDLENEEDNKFDVIFISKQINFKISSDKDIYTKIEATHRFEIDVNKLSIRFKNDDYDLDYIMIAADNDSLCDINCGHCISAIHYDKKEYYYNSGSVIMGLNCPSNSNIIRLPCSLIKNNWTSTLNNNDNNFCIIGCRKIDNYIPYDKLIENEISAKFSNNLCFTNTIVRYCYVRRIPTSGGKGERKNNNKNLMRKVYLDKKLNKYYINYENKRIYLSK
jgi:hypothetical protein